MRKAVTAQEISSDRTGASTPYARIHPRSASQAARSSIAHRGSSTRSADPVRRLHARYQNEVVRAIRLEHRRLTLFAGEPVFAERVENVRLVGDDECVA